MATITTSTTGKKKMVYKQDTDGVFRLKKVPTDGRASGNERENKNASEDHLNELIGCTYQVLNSSTEESRDPSPTPEGILVCPKDTRHVSPEYQPKQKKKSVKINNVNPSHSIRLKVPNIKISTEAFEAMTGIHIPSFVAGCTLTLIFVSSSPIIGHYTSAIFNVVKLVLFWIILLGGITWYSGVLKIPDSEAMSVILNGIKDTFFETEHNEDEEEEEENVGNINIQDVPDDYRRKNSSEIIIPNAVPRRRSASPVKSSRTPASSLSSFKVPTTPKHTSKQDPRFQSNPELVAAEYSSPPKLNRFHTSDPKGYQNHPRKNSSLGKGRRPSNHSLELTKTKTNQSIPSIGLIDSFNSRHSPIKYYSSHNDHDDPEELPFINEVKLISSEDDFRAELTDLHSSSSSNNVKRLSSITSKQSVLGTRTNYNKFLANVQSNDAD